MLISRFGSDTCSDAMSDLSLHGPGLLLLYMVLNLCKSNVSSIQIWPKTHLLAYMCSTMMNIMVNYAEVRKKSLTYPREEYLSSHNKLDECSMLHVHSISRDEIFNLETLPQGTAYNSIFVSECLELWVSESQARSGGGVWKSFNTIIQCNLQKATGVKKQGLVN